MKLVRDKGLEGRFGVLRAPLPPSLSPQRGTPRVAPNELVDA
jgi:hypothetical protein